MELINEADLNELQTYGDFTIEPVTEIIDFSDGYKKLDLDEEELSRINALAHYIPSAMAAGTLNNAYCVKFPDGLQHTLTKLKQGGYGSMYRGEQGHFAGTASLYELRSSAVCLAAFNAMSVASGQYFLSQINTQLNTITEKIDSILKFLYNEKRSDLMAELYFVEQAYHNFNSMMRHVEQRTATIANLQEAKKTAAKDIEFYLVELTERVEREKVKTITDADISEVLEKERLLNISLQLYGLASALEVYYSENYDTSYINAVKGSIDNYVKRYVQKMSDILGSFKTEIKATMGRTFPKPKSLNPELVQKVDRLSRSFEAGSKATILDSVNCALDGVNQIKKCYIKTDGSIYLKQT